MLRQGGRVTAIESQHPLKALGQILLYLAATVLIGALLAPPLYWAVNGVAGHLHNARLDAFVAKTDFQRYFHRSMTIAAIGLLWPLLRALRIGDFGHSLGLRRVRHKWQPLGAGFLLALGSLALLGCLLIFTGAWRMRSHFPYEKVLWLPVTAFTVSVIEEFLFRGVLQGVVRRTTVDAFAIFSVAALFAGVHFLNPRGAEPAEVHWWSGLALLPDTLWQFRRPGLVLGGFTTLLVAGLILGYARHRTHSLWLPVGLHAGWIFGKMALMDSTRQTEAWPWVGPDIMVGLGPLLALLAVWGAVWWLLKDAR